MAEVREMFLQGVHSGAIMRTDEPIMRDLRFTIAEWLDLHYEMRAWYRWLCHSEVGHG